MRAPSVLVATALLAACSSASTGGPVPPNPPTVTVIAGNGAIGTSFGVDVEVSGCDTVTNTTLKDGTRVLASVDNPPPRVSFSVPSTAIDYKDDGIAASMDLNATATCANGQTGTSHGNGFTFLPSQAASTGGFAFTTLNLAGDGKGLYACSAPNVVELGLDGNVLHTLAAGQLGFDCTAAGYTLRGPSGELYWIEPGTGVGRLNADLSAAASTSFSPGPAYLPPSGAGTAIFFTADGSELIQIDRSTGAQIGSASLTGLLDGTPGYGETVVSVPEEVTETSDSSTIVDLEVERFSATTGQAVAAPNVLAQVTVGSLGATNFPVLNLSANGGIAYFVAGPNQDEIYACQSDKNCLAASSGGGLVFHTTLANGPWTNVVPFTDELVVLGPAGAQFTDTSGEPIGNVISPGSNTQILNVVPGANHAYYLLAGSAGGQVYELIILSAPGVEVGRFTLLGGDLGFDLDDSGNAYLLLGHLYELLSPAQYAAARQ